MAAIADSLLGDVLLAQGQNGTVETKTALAGVDVVGIYFSAHWCGPCRGFTPKLVTTLEQLKEDGKSFEIVFVSSDRDEASFKEYFGEMEGFHALPFEDRERKAKLSKKFKVEGIPTLVLVDGSTGVAYNTDARMDVGQDPMGAKFPWKPPTLEEALGAELVRSEGGTVATSEVTKGHFGLYFSAHWCGPCRGFTPRLVETYKKLKAAKKDFEIIFVSSDRDEASFKEYFKEMPWLALPFERRDAKEALSRRFGVQGIPTFVILGPGGDVVNMNGRAAVAGDPEGVEFPWEPRAVNSIENPDGINDTPSVLLFCENEPDARKAELCKALEELAEARRPAKGEDWALRFFTAKENGQISSTIRGMCSLADDGNKAATHLVLLDIPDEGGFYVFNGASTEVTPTAVAQFLGEYESGKLKEGRKQLARM